MDRDEMIITCNCGCNNTLIFRNSDDEEIYVSFAQGYGRDSVGEKIRTVSRLLFKKERWIGTCCVSKRDVEELIAWLGARTLTTESIPDGYNSSYITAEKIFDGEYSLLVMADMKKGDVLRGKLYRAGEIVMDEKERVRLLKILKLIIREKDNKDAKLNSYSVWLKMPDGKNRHGMVRAETEEEAKRIAQEKNPEGRVFAATLLFCNSND